MPLKTDRASFKIFIQFKYSVSEESTDIFINPDTQPVTDLVHPNILQKVIPRMPPVPEKIVFHFLLMMLSDWPARLCQLPSRV